MNHLEYEKKWQKYWSENKLYEVDVFTNKEPFLVMDMFPYPSGAGLHVGHIEGYTGTDIMARFKQMQGKAVLHPMGWDAFGLPAEQYALDTGNDPRDFTASNIEVFKKQLLSAGLVYDWSKEVNTTDPNYYKWTQWIFIQLYKQGLAEVKEIEVNWCSELGTVLANEEVLNVDGKMVSERGGFDVIKKPMKQWVLKISHYAQRLLDDLELLDWSDSLKEMQRNWIGRSEGAKVDFKCVDIDDTISIFTTRPDTLFGATYLVVAPESPIVKKLTKPEYAVEVEEYVRIAATKTDLDRGEINKDKTGVFTGSYAINPVNNEKLPIWIADYVLASYGTGMVMACPAHDERDYDFAKKYGLEIRAIIDCDVSNEAYTKDGIHIDSEFLNGLNNEEAISKMIQFLEENNCGKGEVTFKLRDWVFARQRYWGEPFPVIFYEDGEIELVEDLPLLLPVIENIAPSGTGESPLANETDWVNVVSANGVKGRRETNTMPQWAGSCWYYIGYILKQADGSFIGLDTPEAKMLLDKWLPVDLYVGGTEHAVLHLLYSRFWHKVLFDIGVVSTPEPYQKLFNQGMILGENNEKMSKSKGNVVNPDDIVNKYGADTLRMYEMFMGPLDATKPWSSDSVNGTRKFLERVYRMFNEVIEIKDTTEHDYNYNLLVKQVTSDFEKLRFNTAISFCMTFVNEVYKKPELTKEQALGFLKLLFPIVPHLCEELNLVVLKNEFSLANQEWPTYDESKITKSTMLIIVQVNGKLRTKLEVNVGTSKEEILEMAKACEDVNKHLGEIVKEIYVENKLVNIVVK